MRAAAAFAWMKSLASEPLHEFMRVSRLLEAVNVKPLIVVIKRVTSRAERKVAAKLMDFVVAISLAKPRR
jgi:hypothetical protein